ncbi:unnamed protein product [Sphenostylis stenocarpa]|uniref:non-reducing end alpha-L-arabinofuranosidase n=1 Tax=Sphenostylis stenocarpa TaxID=92480 RepID=A0AA86VC00_9FABA|nr:unnamed protein product [Sphenostylis stenocarpa]
MEIGACKGEMTKKDLRKKEREEIDNPNVLLYSSHLPENKLIRVKAGKGSPRTIPDTFLGVFVEEINHACAGGLWAELVSNRVIGNESSISVSINSTSCFERNKAALNMEVHCGDHNPCPVGGVGVSNPGYWGMNIEEGKLYKVVYHVKSEGNVDFQLSFAGVDVIKVASNITQVSGQNQWKRVETLLKANATNHSSSLQITTTTNGIGPWEERPGHFNDIWNYWSEDGIGYFEYLQLAEDLGALPIWVFNAGISRYEQIKTSNLAPYVQDALDGIEFARGSSKSKWGSLRARLGHPNPFDLRYVAVGNEDCEFSNYQANYVTFHDAIRHAYPDIKIISNCDASNTPLNHSADLFDFHIYTNSGDLFSKSTQFEKTSRSGPKAFVSEYAVWREDAANGSLVAAVAEAAFLIGLEKNSDVVDMVSYAPLFSNINDRKWIPDAIVFNSYQLYGTPSYWVQKLFIESSGATYLNSSLLTTSSSNKLIASGISWQNSTDKKNYLRIKVVNFGAATEELNILIDGFPKEQKFGFTKTVLTSTNKMDENSFSEPTKVVPQTSWVENVSKEINATLSPYSVTSFDLLIY